MQIGGKIDRTQSELFCTVDTPSGPVQGIFSVKEGYFNINLFNFSHRFYIKSIEEINITTQNLYHVSLFKNYSTDDNHHHLRHLNGNSVYYQNIISNLPVYGHDIWHLEDNIKFFTFELPEIDYIFLQSDQAHELLSAPLQDYEKTKILNYENEDLIFTARFRCHQTVGNPNAQIDGVKFEVKFKKEYKAYNFLEPIENIISFFSMNTCTWLRPKNIEISKYSIDEIYSSRIDKNKEHSPHYIIDNNPDDEKSRNHFPAMIFHGRSHEHLNIMMNALELWMNRSILWQHANREMMKCLKNRIKFSSGRLISSYSWLDQILTVIEASNPTKSNDVTKIITAATTCAKDLDRLDLIPRINGSLRNLDKTSSVQATSKSIDYVREKYEMDFLHQSALDIIEKARRLRGRAAHGTLYLSTISDSDELNECTITIEWLAYLLTVADMPKFENRNIAVWSSNFGFVYGAPSPF